MGAKRIRGGAGGVNASYLLPLARRAGRSRMTQPLEFSLTLYPDPILRQVALPVESFDAELRAIVAAMFERMRQSKGVGLAAPQVGLKRRILVPNPTGEPQ